MLAIQKRKNTDGYEDIISSLGLDKDSVNISEAVTGETVDGYIIYTFTDDSVIIYAYDSKGDLYLADGLVRSILFLAALRGIEIAVFECKDKEDLLRLRFITEDNNVLDPISSKLGGCEHCKK